MTHERIVETFDAWVGDGRDAGMEKGHGDVVRQVIGKMAMAPGEKVLDLGCGNGWATRLLAQANAGVQAIGLDASPEMIRRADELHSFTIRARYDWGRFEELEFKDGEFTRVFSMEAIYYPEHLEKVLVEVFRVLAPDGKADVILDHYVENPASQGWAEGLGFPIHNLDEAAWRAAFEQAGFTTVTTARVIDSRGPGDEASFEPSVWCPDWATCVAGHESGSLWIHAEKSA